MVRAAACTPKLNPSSDPPLRTIERAKQIVESRLFPGFIIIVILGAGVLAGGETNAALVAQHAGLLRFLEATVLGIFIVEIALKLDSLSDGWVPYWGV